MTGQDQEKQLAGMFLDAGFTELEMRQFVHILSNRHNLHNITAYLEALSQKYVQFKGIKDALVDKIEEIKNITPDDLEQMLTFSRWFGAIYGHFLCMDVERLVAEKGSTS